ncbi:uncharacterized protein [Procambarus clarkii]|uniref:uncharacterized protein n=1 Tax=Procambarus clarkii TaxID=6728 RepID=UPI001E672AEA|nr:E3 ubiquitin-protein ligase rififylin-like [Procambarus clarkii]
MLGGRASCGGPVSWWCSEVWRCSPKVAPDVISASTLTVQMSDCDQCSSKFSLLKRRRVCGGCGLQFCGSCIKRGMGGTRRCNKCLVLTQWPLDISEVTALRVKDLIYFLHSQHINTAACTEKRDLIELVTRHISIQHRGVDVTSRQGPPGNVGNGTANASEQTNRKHPLNPTDVPGDDGIRVRPSSISPTNTNNMDSIRVRAMDSIRVRPGPSLSPDTDTSDYDPEADLGIRVFATEKRANQPHAAFRTSPMSPEGCSESVEERCSHCPSEDCTTSCCSLDSCHNGASSRPSTCPVNASSQDSFEFINASCDGQLPDTLTVERTVEHVVPGAQFEPFQFHETEESFERIDLLNGTTQESPLEAATNSLPDTHPSAPLLDDLPPASATSSASSSAPPSSASSPEPNKSFVASIIPLADIKSEEDIRRLNVRQCKEILSLHRVNYSGVREKSELFKKIEILWRDYQNSQQDVETLPEELVCKICMDSIIDCVLLECGHMVACTQCGKQMSECPVCRQYVVRVVRTFRA